LFLLVGRAGFEPLTSRLRTGILNLHCKNAKEEITLEKNHPPSNYQGNFLAFSTMRDTALSCDSVFRSTWPGNFKTAAEVEARLTGASRSKFSGSWPAPACLSFFTFLTFPIWPGARARMARSLVLLSRFKQVLRQYCARVISF